ncbi:hypothetical protein [Gordonia sp. CPCC 205333]|uniref:hypothetical protein n=1 Tax=Gordonia sp. CPCC 205333 TaxID=3140790 RepID=UPI003AF381EC
MSPFLLSIAAIGVLVYVVTKTVIPADSAPQSASYLNYRRTMRRRLKVAFIIPIVAMAASLLYGMITVAIDSEQPPDIKVLRVALGALWWPGLFLLPLIAMIITERTTRPSGPRIATLAPRGIRTLLPRWILIAVGTVGTLAALSPIVLLSPIGRSRILLSANNPPHQRYSIDATDLWISYTTFITAAVLAAALIHATTRRPDIDPLTGSDSWSRSGTAVRALCLLYIPATGVIADVAAIVKNASLDYVDHLRAHGDTIVGLGWLRSGTVPYIAEGFAALLYLGVIVALVAFARPPAPRALAAPAPRNDPTPAA